MVVPWAGAHEVNWLFIWVQGSCNVTRYSPRGLLELTACNFRTELLQLIRCCSGTAVGGNGGQCLDVNRLLVGGGYWSELVVSWGFRAL